MRFTTTLYRQHIQFMFKKHWRLQGQRKVQETNTAAELIARGINVQDPNEYLKKFERRNPVEINLHDIFEKPLTQDENHPDYKAQPCYVYGDSNVLVQGISQAQALLNTLVFDELPEKVEDMFRNTKIPADVERSMQQAVLVSHLLDAEQQKTEKIVNPLRPMRPYPRNYGITEARKNMLLSKRLLNHCERFQGHLVTADRKIINNAYFVSPFEKDGEKILFELTAETFMSSRKPISPFSSNKSEHQISIPNIFPLKHTVSIPKVNFYNNQIAYPIKSINSFSHPHTILLHYSKLDVKHLFGTPVTSDQFESRAMMKGFAAAASRAQTLYGKHVKELEKPITVQVVQFESAKIQFGIFQLNTLDLNSESSSKKNFWFRKEAMNLYENCEYIAGRPALTNYNFDVFRLMNVFYSN